MSVQSARVSRPLIFIAYTLPAEAASALATWVEEALGGADELRLVPAENLHITLVFCGRLPADRVEEVDRAGRAPPSRSIALRSTRPRASACWRARLSRSNSRLRSPIERGAAGHWERLRSS